MCATVIRNLGMMMVQEETGRVFWSDFDRADLSLWACHVALRHYGWLVMDVGMTE